MPITGAHILLHSTDAVRLREVLSDVMEWRSVDAGDGWLIFTLPPAELGVHPADAPQHELSLMCDDIEATASGLRGKGIEFRGDIEHRGFGRAVTMLLPGGVEVLLYEPRHPTAI
jgi:hypothetical protein